jgi:enamine deaminase RidA (YjgF/YER057c/UK114 family)
MSKKIMINPSGKGDGRLTFAQAVRKGNMLFISGQNASKIDPDTGKRIAKGDIVEQTKVIYDKIKVILEAAESSFYDIVQTTDYILSMENYRDTAEVRRQHFRDSFPASTGIIVKGLMGKGVLIEVDAVAVLD